MRKKEKEQTIEEPAMHTEGGDGIHAWQALTANRQRVQRIRRWSSTEEVGVGRVDI